MATTVPGLRQDSVLGWELESTFKTAPAASNWRSFGRVTEWTDLGPRRAISRDFVAGAGREPHAMVVEGMAYGGNVGPFQVYDPRILGLIYGQEPGAPAALGGGYFRHTVQPTANAQRASISVQMRDLVRTSPTVTDKTTFLGTVCKRTSLRGEAPNDDGSGGRLMTTLGLFPHDDDDTVADKTVTLPTGTPYRFGHGKLSFWGEQVARVEDWSLDIMDEEVAAYYWQDSNGDKPYETPPGGFLHEFGATIMVDGEKFTGSGYADKLIRQIAREGIFDNATLRFIRTTNQDEFQLNLTDLGLLGAPKERRDRGKNRYRITGYVRSSTMSWVDTSSTRFYPT